MAKQHLHLCAVLIVGSGVIADAPVRADGFEMSASVGRQEASKASGMHVRYVRRRHLRQVSRDALYRDPRFILGRHGPGVLIQAYLPRYTEVPMYNEPPRHFSTR